MTEPLFPPYPLNEDPPPEPPGALNIVDELNVILVVPPVEPAVPG